MAIDNIDELDNLNTGRVKLNEAIDQANTVQGQLDTIVIASGTSDAEVIQARGDEPLLYNRLDKVDTQLAHLATEQMDYINIKRYENLVTNDDWTIAIQQAITDIGFGGTIYFPKGTYRHTGIVINRSGISIKGYNKLATKLLNVGTGDSITIEDNAERGTFSDISIFGNATASYGVGATAKKGVLFKNNAIHWKFYNIWMRDHGDWFFYANQTGHVNNINIQNSEFEHGGKGAARFIQSSSAYQINAISIKNCNVSGFETNGLELWGQSITIEDNTIQACKGRGIVIDAGIGASGSGHASNIRICNNYFELCNKGFVLCSALVSPYVRYINGITVERNYGLYNTIDGSVVDFETVHVVEVKAAGYSDFDSNKVSGFIYKGNSFSTGGKAKSILNANNAISYDSMVHKVFLSTYTPELENDYIGLGRARILTNSNTRKIIKGITSCFSHTYTVEKSPSITVSTFLKYDINTFSDNKIKRLKIPVNTDSQNYTLSISINHRTINTFGSYTKTPIDSRNNLVGDNILSVGISGVYSPMLEKDYFLGIDIVFNDSSQTFLYVGNLEVETY